MIWLWLSATFMVTTALVHGLLGERRRVSPLTMLDQAAWTATGRLDAIHTRGKHIGWPFLTAAGLCALVGAA